MYKCVIFVHIIKIILKKLKNNKLILKINNKIIKNIKIYIIKKKHINNKSAQLINRHNNQKMYIVPPT